MRQNSFWWKGVAGFMIAISGGLVGQNYASWSNSHTPAGSIESAYQGCAWLLNCILWFCLMLSKPASLKSQGMREKTLGPTSNG
jgi:hypothetical protein